MIERVYFPTKSRESKREKRKERRKRRTEREMMLRWRVISQLTVHGSGPAECLPPYARSMSIRSDMYKSIEAVRKKREATKLEGQKKKEQPRYDKAVLQAHRELEDERLFEERKRVYGAEVA